MRPWVSYALYHDPASPKLSRPDLSNDLRALTDRLIEDANDVSGDIVLRAAKRGQSASELIGVVLSRRLVRELLGRDSLVGWYFLDDYAAWMGQREEQLADLLAMSPQVAPDGVLRISLAVSEAKYVDLTSLAVKKKESQKQLRDTLRRIEEAVFGNPARLDREVGWLARLADLMLDGIRVPQRGRLERLASRDAGGVVPEIDLEGYSHVFVSTAASDTVADRCIPSARGARCVPRGLRSFGSGRTAPRLIGEGQARSISGGHSAQIACSSQHLIGQTVSLG